MKIIFYTILFSLLPLNINAAYWQIVESNDENNTLLTDVAQIQNEEGFVIQIYLDEYSEVKLRFKGSQKYSQLSSEYCPTFQVDNYTLFNRSFDGEKCTQTENSFEYGLGNIEFGRIDSTALYRIQNGNILSFRFIHKNEGYGETQFTLTGSSRIILNILGPETVIRKTRR